MGLIYKDWTKSKPAICQQKISKIPGRLQLLCIIGKEKMICLLNASSEALTFNIYKGIIFCISCRPRAKLANKAFMWYAGPLFSPAGYNQFSKPPQLM